MEISLVTLKLQQRAESATSARWLRKFKNCVAQSSMS